MGISNRLDLGKYKISRSVRACDTEIVATVPSHSLSVSSATVYCLETPSVSHNRPRRLPRTTHPKYRNGHILKCLISTLSSLSAKLRSLRGLPRARGAGAFDFGLLVATGAACTRISWPSTSSSCCREHGAQVQPYPRLGFASRGGVTHAIWKKLLHLSHWTVSGL